MMENGKVESCAFSPPSSPPAPFPLPQGAATQTTQPTGPQGSACPADAIRGPFGEIGQRPLLAAQAALGLARPVVSVLRAAPVCPLTEACLCPALDGLAPGSPAAPVGLHLDPAPDLQGPHPLPPWAWGAAPGFGPPPPGGSVGGVPRPWKTPLCLLPWDPQRDSHLPGFHCWGVTEKGWGGGWKCRGLSAQEGLLFAFCENHGWLGALHPFANADPVGYLPSGRLASDSRSK